MEDLIGVAEAPDETRVLRAELARWQIEAIRQRNRAERLARIVHTIPANPIPPGEKPDGVPNGVLSWMETVAAHHGFEMLMKALGWLWRRADPEGAWTLGPAACRVRMARAELEDAPDPDWCYDPKDWEQTHAWDDLDELVSGLAPHEVRPVATLYNGPLYWFAEVPQIDPDGSSDETELQLFRTEDEARAAVQRAEEAVRAASLATESEGLDG